ncbi:MAG TPA: rhombosortase [Rheinheimera sp.]|nr:rhombosortase [Rheinheimera sp.]
MSHQLFSYRKYSLPFVLFLLCFFAQCADSVLDPWFGYNAHDVGHGQWWRLWTPYLIHTNWTHFVINMSALAIISYLHIGYYRPLTFSMLVLLGFPLITLQTFLFSSSQLQFVGLSGWLHALLVFGALVDTRRHFTSGWLILAGVAAKVGWENWLGAGSLTEHLIDARVATESHLWGCTTGILLFGFFMLAMVRKVYQRRSRQLQIPPNAA